MNKKRISLLLALALLCTLLPQVALPASAETYSGAWGDNITWTVDSETDTLALEGSGTIGSDEDTMENLSFSGQYNKVRVKTVTVGEGITSTGGGTFTGYRSLTSVSLPDSLTRIGECAFSYCNELPGVTIPNGVTEIRIWAFIGCNSMHCVTIPASVTQIGEEAFGYLYTWQRDLDFTIIGYEGTAAQEYAEENDFNFIALGENVVSGSCGAEGDGSNLTWVLDTESGLLTIYGSGAMRDFSCGETPWKEYCETIQAVSLPDGLTNIGSYSFSECSGLTSVTIPDSVTEIEWGAFYKCSALPSVTIPDNVASIGGEAFFGCSSLTNATIGNGVKSISYGAFYKCTSLTSVEIPIGVTSIGNETFYNCIGLTNVTIPETVTSIGGGAFAWCSALMSVTIPGSVTNIGRVAFYNCSALSSVTIEDGVTSIGDMAFYNCIALTKVTIPASMTRIEEKAFGWSDTDDGKVAGFTIYGYSGTAAEAYAEENGFPFFFADRFADVTPSNYFFYPVMWAVNHEPQITAGVGEGQFGPHNDCTREQIVTFLWAANGKPEPAGTGETFSDVSADAWYYKPVAWAVENKITSGIGDGLFGVGNTCTRAQAVTFLYAAAGGSEFEMPDSSFSDVAECDWFYNPVMWAVTNNVTSGIGDGKFGPSNTCTRAQIVTFLWASEGRP